MQSAETQRDCIALCGERGKPDLILPKYVRNDITLSM